MKIRRPHRGHGVVEQNLEVSCRESRPCALPGFSHAHQRAWEFCWERPMMMILMMTLFCHETGSSSSNFNTNKCNMKQFARRFRFLRFQ